MNDIMWATLMIIWAILFAGSFIAKEQKDRIALSLISNIFPFIALLVLLLEK